VASTDIKIIANDDLYELMLAINSNKHMLNLLYHW